LVDTYGFPRREWEIGDLRLRLLRPDDAADLAATCDDPRTHRFLMRLVSPYTVEDAREYIAGPAVDAWRDGRAQWAIADAATDRYLGSIGVPRTQPSFDTAEIGFLVAPWARGRGVAPRAAAAVADFLFQHGIRRAELHIMPENVPSQRAALRAGFAYDARLREAIANRDGGRSDRLIYSRLPGDPPGPIAPSLPRLPGDALTDGTVTVRPLGPDDADACFALNDSPEVWRRQVPPTPPSREAIDRMCGFGSAGEWVNGTTARMAIRDAAGDAFAGLIGLHLSMGPPGEAMLSYSLDRRFRGRGLVTRAVRLVSAWAIEQVGVDRLMAGTAADNLESQAVLKRCGFTSEGTQRAMLPGPDGTRVDNITWSLLPGEA
jgi:RimJ/RimL family protein N-acetyltransferase